MCPLAACTHTRDALTPIKHVRAKGKIVAMDIQNRVPTPGFT